MKTIELSGRKKRRVLSKEILSVKPVVTNEKMRYTSYAKPSSSYGSRVNMFLYRYKNSFSIYTFRIILVKFFYKIT